MLKVHYVLKQPRDVNILFTTFYKRKNHIGADKKNWTWLRILSVIIINLIIIVHIIITPQPSGSGSFITSGVSHFRGRKYSLIIQTCVEYVRILGKTFPVISKRWTPEIFISTFQRENFRLCPTKVKYFVWQTHIWHS